MNVNNNTKANAHKHTHCAHTLIFLLCKRHIKRRRGKGLCNIYKDLNVHYG